MAAISKTRVLLLISDLEFGGAQRQVVELANRMDPARFDVHVCTLADYIPLGAALNSPEKRLHVIRKWHRFDFTVVPRLAQLMKRLKVDVVHTFLFDAEFFGRLAAGLAGVCLVVGSERNTNYVPHRRHIYAYAATRRLNDLVIANSEAGARFYSKMFNVPFRKLRVVHNGVDTRRFRPRDGAPLRESLGIGVKEYVIGVFASFKPQKNHAMMLRAARRLIDGWQAVRVVFVGDELYRGMSDSVAYKQQIKALIESLGLKEYCLFVGNRPDPENYYTLCDVTVLPSLFEGTPNVALESMASGIPVIATSVSDNTKLIVEGRTGYTVPVDDDAALAQRLRKVLCDRALRQDLGKQAREWVVSEFSSQRLADKTAAVYEEGLTKRQTTPQVVGPACV